ncbi:hypothetical protein G6F68_012717 [Rhizopus microsporus]|nr:hypothetical protein G6F68_012717 [Rhizopus microsporus]
MCSPALPLSFRAMIADGELFNLPAGGVRAAFGAGYRRDGYELLDHRGLEKPVDLQRTIRSAFAELNVPLLADTPGVRRLSLTAAARYDNYSDFGSTLNPKLGLLWEATEGLSFRTSYGRSYRAPVYQDMQLNNTVVVAKVPNPSAASGSTVLMMLSNGNPDLGPERAKTWTGGFSFAPPSLPGFKRLRWQLPVAVPAVHRALCGPADRQSDAAADPAGAPARPRPGEAVPPGPATARS